MPYICPKCCETDTINNKTKSVAIVKCNKCGLVFLVSSSNEIDKGIIETIALLNRKGYTTRFSCEGHDDWKYWRKHPQAYIFFCERGLMREVVKEYPIPDSWFIDNSAIGFILRSSAKHKTRLDDIYKWAESLPQKTFNGFYYGYGGASYYDSNE